jgi:hypothetical protein
MFEQILKEVKEHLGNNPQVAENIPAEQADAIHHEIATHIHEGLQKQPETQSEGVGGILSQLQNSLASGGMLTSAVTGGLVGSLASKFGLSPAITGAIAASLPGLLQKYMHKNDAAEVAIPSTTTP